MTDRDESRPRLDEIVEHVQAGERSSEAIWRLLRKSFASEEVKWSEPGKVAKKAMERLVQVVHSAEPASMGITVHQAKGLEWERVLLLDELLTTDDELGNLLSIEHDSHRSLYVGLTRARVGVWHAKPTSRPYGVEREDVQHVQM